MSSKDKTKRSILINGLDVELELSKVTCIKNDGFKSIHIDQLPDGTYRLCYGSGIIDDIQKVKSLDIIRQD
jgi:hypothetical protein